MKKGQLILFVALLVSLNGQASDALFCYQEGRMLRERGEYVAAMEAFIQGIHAETNDQALRGRIYSNVANMCRQADDHRLASEVYALSVPCFRTAGDTLACAYAFNNVAWEMAVMGKKDTARMLIDSALAFYPRSPLTDKVIETKAAACFFRQEYDSVLYYTCVPEATDYLLMLRAQAFSYLQMNDSALYYAQLLVPRMTDLFYLDDLYYILTHNDETADVETIRKLSSARADVKKQIQIRHGQLVQAVQLLRQDLYSETSHLPISVYLLAGLLLCMLLCGAGVFYKQWRFRSEKGQFEEKRKHELRENVQLILKADDLKEELMWNDYEAMCKMLNYRFQNLAYKLQLQKLNEQDIRLCTLVLLGLKHKQIADILNCSPKSVGKLKDLTARKLGVSGGQLQDKLLNISIL